VTSPHQEVSQSAKTCKRGHSYISKGKGCPECHRIGMKIWQENNRDHVRQVKRARYLANREEVIRKAQEWADKNYDRWYSKRQDRLQRDRDKIRLNALIHRQKNREKGIWVNMKQRCSNPDNIGYKYYGGRGITVCERWMVFENFFKDMGPRPTPRHSIERRDNDKGYGPDNCYWATPAQQNRNTRRTRMLEFNGKRQCMADWAEELGITSSLLCSRLDRWKWPIERALTTGPYRRT